MIKPRLPYRKELVIGRGEHLGYHGIVAYLADCGATREAILAACAEAAEDKAPKDALCKRGGRWYRRSEITLTSIGRRLDSYTAALVAYEKALDTEQKTDRR